MIKNRGRFRSNHLSSREDRNRGNPLSNREDRAERNLTIGRKNREGSKKLTKSQDKEGQGVETCNQLSNLDPAQDKQYPDKNVSLPTENPRNQASRKKMALTTIPPIT